ncbi:hypothetical protein [Yersinia sp. Marseille-Q3913]|uniref:hypothetical protein n=1 Tax=Yersinia sp. Marseille-Q3913 TaxID=2830769 RepID=UPI001BAEE6E5|nr:hypothetical protein [Yersinia sp. Marseille-Q3913]MBS0057652.1 hypothetical protein [Yersinia sp. Marseille-Q3913]
MFQNFFLNGSIIAIVMMEFASFMAFKIGRDWQLDPRRMYTPGIIHRSIFIPFVFAAAPLSIWIGIYVGVYDGWMAGIIMWVIVQLIGSFVLSILLTRMRFLYAPFALLAIPACIAGYYLSIDTILHGN